MTADEVIAFMTAELEGTLVVVASEENGAPQVAWGDAFFIYDPEKRITPERHFPYATIVNHDYPGFDESDLNREGVFRVNMWVSPETSKRETADSGAEAIDYGALDRVIPPPVYGKQSWLSVLSPGEAAGDKVKTLLAEAHRRAQVRYHKSTTAEGDCCRT
jgi:hypothetical protein